MKKIILYFLLSGLSILAAPAQIFISGGVMGMKVGYPTFEKFAESYNGYVNDLDKEIKPFRFGTGYYYGSWMSVSGILFDFNWSRISAGTKATFTDGSKREFDLSYNCFSALAGGGYYEDGAGLWAYLGSTVGTIKLKSKFYYPDGSFTIGLDHSLSGVYELPSGKFLLGVRGLIPLMDNVSIQLDFCYVFKGYMFGFDEIYDESPAVFNSMRKIPTDYQGYWEARTSGQDYSGEYMLHDMRGFRASAGISILLLDE